MHFYDFNIGDYAKKTAHLTNGEDLAYRRALDVYYDTEKPFEITHGLATLSRRLRVDENDLKNVIEEFFPDGRNKHADEKIAAYYAFLERQKTNGKLGGRPKHKEHKPSANPVVSQIKPTATPVPTQPLTTNHLPLTIDINTLAQTSFEAGDESELEKHPNKDYTKAFLTFWDLYPRKKSKGDAAKAFSKIPKSEYKEVRAGLDSALASVEWAKDNGQFIPYPASWIRDRGWEDVYQVRDNVIKASNVKSDEQVANDLEARRLKMAENAKRILSMPAPTNPWEEENV